MQEMGDSSSRSLPGTEFGADRKVVLERFGERLRHLRVEARKSPHDLAFDLRITAAHLEEIENGLKDVDLILLEQIAITLGLNLEQLLAQV